MYSPEADYSLSLRLVPPTTHPDRQRRGPATRANPPRQERYSVVLGDFGCLRGTRGYVRHSTNHRPRFSSVIWARANFYRLVLNLRRRERLSIGLSS